MNYGLEKNTTHTEKSLVEQLIEKNSEGIKEMRTDLMPVMVPIQEKDWDTMVGLLQSAVDFQPKVYELMKTLLTVSKMESMVDRWTKAEADFINRLLNQVEIKLNTQQTAVENIMHRMESHEEQAGKNLESIMKDTLDKGSQLEAAIAKASVKTDRRTWLIRTAISVGASVASAVFGVLLCVHWLV